MLANEHLMLLAESDEAGCYLIKDDQGNIYLLGHPEYDRMSLDAEYKRDLAKAWMQRFRFIIMRTMIHPQLRFLHGEGMLTRCIRTG